MKTCRICKESKPTSSYCKRSKAKDGLQYDCKDCTNTRNKIAYLKHPDREKERIASEQCKSERSSRPTTTWASRNRENARDRCREWASKNREKIAAYTRNRRKKNPTARLAHNLRVRVGTIFKDSGYSKESTSKLIGIKFDRLLPYMIQTAIQNYGKYFPKRRYHIDHIVPLSSAKTEDELLKLQHYTNLQYLYPKDNLRKSNKLDYKGS